MVARRMAASVVFGLCVGVAVEHVALHITHGATVALICGAVISFFAAVLA
jgi:hypothetical protein